MGHSLAEQFNATETAPDMKAVHDFYWAVAKGNLADVKDFIDKYGREHINDANVGEGNPFWTSVIANKPDVAELLIKSGADPNMCMENDRGSFSALRTACENGLYEVAAVLVDNGADWRRERETWRDWYQELEKIAAGKEDRIAAKVKAHADKIEKAASAAHKGIATPIAALPRIVLKK